MDEMKKAFDEKMAACAESRICSLGDAVEVLEAFAESLPAMIAACRDRQGELDEQSPLQPDSRCAPIRLAAEAAERLARSLRAEESLFLTINGMMRTVSALRRSLAGSPSGEVRA